MRCLLQLRTSISTLVCWNSKSFSEVFEKVIVKVYNVPVGAEVFGQLDSFTRVQFVPARVLLKAIGGMDVIYQRHELFRTSATPAVDALLCISNNECAVWIFIFGQRMLNERM